MNHFVYIMKILKILEIKEKSNILDILLSYIIVSIMGKVCFEDKTLNIFLILIVLLITICYYSFNNMTNMKKKEDKNNMKQIQFSNNNFNNQDLQSCNIKLQNSNQELVLSNKKLVVTQKDLNEQKENLSSCKLEKKSIPKIERIIHTNEGVNYKRLSDPLLPPERTYPYMKTQMVPINIPTRGYPEEFQQYGVLMKNDDSGKTFSLFGRREYPGSRNYEYFVTSSSSYNAVKIPLPDKKEIYDGAEIPVPGHEGQYKVKLYKLDTPRYIPNVY